MDGERAESKGGMRAAAFARALGESMSVKVETAAERIVREFCAHFVASVPHARLISAAADVVWFEVDGEPISFGPDELVARARAAPNAAERTRIYASTVESFLAARAR